MEFLCLNCGLINEGKNQPCIKCAKTNNQENYEKIMSYSKKACYYGYDYRIVFEEQVSQIGYVNEKANLPTPDNYQEFLAAAALSGFIGNFGYDLIKYLANQVKEKLLKKKGLEGVSYNDDETLKLVQDNNQLNKFAVYVRQYYKGLPNIDKKVEE